MRRSTEIPSDDLKVSKRESEQLDKDEDAFVLARRRCGHHRAGTVTGTANMLSGSSPPPAACARGYHWYNGCCYPNR
jgi:hypothetical protein